MMDARFWHALPAEEALAAFSSDAARGLSEAEAARRLAQAGKNRLPAPKADTFGKRLLRQLRSPIAMVLLLAALATLLIAHYTDAFVIALALLVNVVIGLFQEGKAGSAFAALAREEAPHALVIREDARREIAAEELVPGDIVVLSAGAKVPADVRLIETHELSVQEAALTGEWMPVEKKREAASEEAPLAERSGMAYAGTLVAGGTGTGVVVATGGDTELGAIARELSQIRRAETPLQRDMKQIARTLLALIAFVIIAIGGLALYQGMTVGDTLLIAISLAVAAIPEGLPAAVTVVLALGMERILKSGGLVRNLLAAETLGATSIILTDKTGTLTEGRMKAVGFATLAGTTETADGPAARAMLRAAVLASDGYLEEVDAPSPEADRIVARGRPVEQAILLAGLEAGFPERKLRTEFPRLDELPFSSGRRYGGMLVEEAGAPVAYVAGAPELFLAHAARSVNTPALSAEHVAFYEEALLRSAREGKRVLAVARIAANVGAFPPERELDAFLEGVELFGFIVFSDVVRKDARASVKEMQDAGARVIMLTGDNPETALWFGRAVGIAGKDERARTGADISGLSDDDLAALLREHAVFARVTPADKLRIARALAGAGEVVAMTGDGVNDAPALEASAIGVALGSGTDVAKEASDLVLLNDSFSVITKAIAEGRRLRDNVKKMFAYMLSTNGSEIFVISAALLFGLPLPILPTQIIWTNLINGGPMNVALAFEPLYPSAMKRSPKHPDIANVLSPEVVKLVASVAVLTGLMLVGLFLLLISAGMPEQELRTIMFGALTLSSIAGAFSLKSFGTPLGKLPLFSNPWLVASFTLSVAMLLAALFVPAIQAIVHTVSVAPSALGLIALAGLLNLVLIEAAKEVFFIGPARRARAA